MTFLVLWALSLGRPECPQKSVITRYSVILYGGETYAYGLPAVFAMSDLEDSVNYPVSS